MSLERGTYGIEYDGRRDSPFRKLWIPAALILALLVPLFFFRGCGAAPERDPLTDDLVGQTRYRVPDVETPRERASLWKHFLNFRQSTESAAEGRPAPETAVPAKGAGGPFPQAKAPQVVTVQSPEVQKLLEQVTAYETADDPVNARLVLQQILLRRDADDVRAFAERKIGSLNTALVFGNRPMPEKTRHRIVAGDLIGKIAKRYGNTQEYLLKANGIDKPELLRIGREIWVLQAPVFELTVFKRSSSAVLTLNDRFFKRYEIGIGKPAHVPSGTYSVRSKVKNPAYRLPGGGEVAFGHPQNILGTRWVSLTATGATPETKRLGLHGTWNVSALGRPSEAGLIRFRNADIEELCVLLPDGTAVNVTD